VNGEFTVEDFVSVDESRDLAEGLFGTRTRRRRSKMMRHAHKAKLVAERKQEGGGETDVEGEEVGLLVGAGGEVDGDDLEFEALLVEHGGHAHHVGRQRHPVQLQRRHPLLLLPSPSRSPVSESLSLSLSHASTLRLDRSWSCLARALPFFIAVDEEEDDE